MSDNRGRRNFSSSHVEVSYPHTRKPLSVSFANLIRNETTKILITSAAEMYGFVLGALTPLSKHFCCGEDEVTTPIGYSEIL